MKSGIPVVTSVCDNILRTMSRMNSIVQEILEASSGIVADADDGIFSDPVALGLEEVDADVEIESEESIHARLRAVVTGSLDGADLFSKICSNFPNSANSYGLALSMNRAIKCLVAANKLSDGALVGWRRLPKTIKAALQSAFSAVVKESDEWNSLVMVILKHEKTKKNTKRNSSLLTATSTAPLPVEVPEEDDTDKNRLVDRVALLACALIDADLLDMWTEISAPIPVSERPAGYHQCVFDNAIDFIHDRINATQIKQSLLVLTVPLLQFSMIKLSFYHLFSPYIS